MTKLKPCPFCGKQPKMLNEYMFSRAREATQIVCKCGSGIIVYGKSSKKFNDEERESTAIRAWNTRVGDRDD